MCNYYTWLSELPAEIDFLSGTLSIEPNTALGKASFGACEHARVKLDFKLLAALQDISSADIAITHALNEDVCIVFEPARGYYNGITGTASVIHKLDKELMGDATYRCPMCGHAEFNTYSPPFSPTGNAGEPAETTEPEVDNDTLTQCGKCSFIGERCAFNTIIWDNAEPPAEGK